MPTVFIELPEDGFAALRRPPTQLMTKMRIAAALWRFQSGQMSRQEAARIAGLSEIEFNKLASGRKSVADSNEQ